MGMCGSGVGIGIRLLIQVIQRIMQDLVAVRTGCYEAATGTTTSAIAGQRTAVAARPAIAAAASVFAF